MLWNYLTTALRSFHQHKQNFILNVLGLSVGLAAAIIVALFAQNELSYDNQQPDAERVYRILTDYGVLKLPLFNLTQAEKTLKSTMVEDIFSIEMLEYSNKKTAAVKYKGQGFTLRSFYGATPNIEDFIKIKVITGNLKITLSTPDSLALSQSEALRIFGSLDIIGKTLLHEHGQYTIRAVFEDLPENTHFEFKSLAHVENDPTNIDDNFCYIYVKLTAQSDPQAYAKMLSAQSFTGDNKNAPLLELIPLRDLHFTAKSVAEFKKGGDKYTVMICFALSALLTFVVSFNFINMSVAQSTKRAKEVGVRKALGASRYQLVVQFLSESLLISAFATAIACTLIELCLPNINQLIGRELIIDYSVHFGMLIVGFAALVGILSGLYPAFYISSFSSKQLLSGEFEQNFSASLVRKALLILQAAIAISLIITAVIMNQQLVHLQSLPLGYETKQRLVISELPAKLVHTKDTTIMVNKLNAIEGVQQVTHLGFDITKSSINQINATWPNGQKAESAINVTGTGFNIVEGLGLTLLAGRDFSSKFSSDWNTQVYEPFKRNIGAIVTESVARQAGYKNIEDIVGKTIKDTNPQYATDMRVVGVVADITIGNGESSDKSFIFLCGYPSANLFETILTIAPQKYPSIKKQIIKILGEHANIFEPQISLLAEDYKALFVENKRVADLVAIFTYLTIFLTCLGIFGLASFSALRRQKEVAMRKVLGASRFSIVNILAHEFLLLIVISVAVAFPVTYWLLGDWLANFNERIEQSIELYIFAALTIAAVTWLTVATIAFKAASSKPSLILRDE